MSLRPKKNRFPELIFLGALTLALAAFLFFPGCATPTDGDDTTPPEGWGYETTFNHVVEMTDTLSLEPHEVISDEDWKAFLSSLGLTDEGWIDERGKWWPVDDAPGGWLHGHVAEWILGENGELEAERRGWVRISNYGNRTTRPLNKKQRDTLFDYATHFGVCYQTLMDDIRIVT